MFFINRPYALLHHDKFDIRFHHLLDNMFAHAIWNAFYLSGIFLYYLLFALFQQDELHHFVFVPLNPRTSQIERIIGWVIYPSGAFPNSVQLRHAQAAGAYVTVLALCPWRVLPAVWTAGSALLCLRRRAVPRHRPSPRQLLASARPADSEQSCRLLPQRGGGRRRRYNADSRRGLCGANWRAGETRRLMRALIRSPEVRRARFMARLTEASGTEMPVGRVTRVCWWELRLCVWIFCVAW